MKSKLQVQLENAYELVLEAKGAPCPCTMGKKCTKKGCECKACHKSLKESHGTYDGNRLASDAKRFSKAHTGEGPQRMTGPEDYDFLKHKTKGEPLSELEMKEAMGILEDYAAGAIGAKEAAELFKALYDRSAGM